MSTTTASPQSAPGGDDLSRVMVRLGAIGVVVVLGMAGVVAWSHWQDTRQRTHFVLESYAGVYAGGLRNEFALQTQRLRDTAVALAAAPADADAALRRAIGNWPDARLLALIDDTGRMRTEAGAAMTYPAQDPRLDTLTRAAWARCPSGVDDCATPAVPDPQRPGHWLTGELHRLAQPVGAARWLALAHEQGAARLLTDLHTAYPSATLEVLRRTDGLRQIRAVGAAQAPSGPQRPDDPEFIIARLPLDDVPFDVLAAVPRQALLTQWFDELLPYGELLAAICLLGAALLLVGARRLHAVQRLRREAMQGLARVSAFQALRARTNELVAAAEGEQDLLQSICDAAIGLSAVRLVWVGRVDAAGRAHVVAAAGATGYLGELDLSVNPQEERGRGPFASAWRSGTPQFNPSFSVGAPYWTAQATAYALVASAAVPIRRNERVDAVLSLYWGEAIAFDESFKELLREAADDIGRGLERLDLISAQREATRAHERQGELMRTVFSQIDVLIAARDETELLETACTRLLEGGLFAAAWIGQPDATDEVQVLAAAGEARETLARFPIQLAPQSQGGFARTWRTGLKAIEVEPDSPLLAPWAAYALPGCRQEAITLPIRRSDTLWGVLVLVAMDGADLDQIVQDTLLRTGELIGQALTEIDLKRLLRTRESEQAHLARHDALTGLANRLALEQHLPRAIARARRSGHHLAIGVLDLDDFKPVNDNFGHAAGDLLLQELARRLQAEMRESDLLARLGGDEFVLVLDDLESVQPRQALAAILGRLHRAVERPFDLGAGLTAEVGMSMGLAVYPEDGEEADLLLRQADVALYAAKAGKARRERWWLLSGEQIDDVHEEAVGPYGPAAAALLAKAQDDLRQVEDEFVEDFYHRLSHDPASSRLLALLDDAEFDHLRLKQREHLRRLLAPELTQEEHERMSLRLGRTHATVGVDSSTVMAAMNQYSAALHRVTQRMPLRLEARVKLQSVLQDRLSTELQVTQRGSQEVEHERQAHLAMMEMQIERWEESGQLPRQVVAHLGLLDGICGVACGRPDVNNRYVLEFADGVAADYLQASRDAGHDLVFQRTAQELAGPTQRAWSSGVVATEPNECRVETFGPIARRFGVRSTAAIPLLDRSGHVHLVITLMGRHPGQFDATGMRLWLDSVQHQLNPAFQRVLAGQAQPIAATRRAHLHDLLFGGGLRMYVQPLVNMVSGVPDKVEMLARLVDGDRVLAPGEFLEAFGNHELRVLFRKGLEQSLQWARAWDGLGLHIDVSVNLPPSVLLDPECASWTAQALADSGLDARRLYLELLETHEDLHEGERRDAAIAALSQLGVRLIMDDLGSGYSSLKRMRSLPFHTVKIDQQIVAQAHEDPVKTIAFIGALVRMAQGLGMQVTMEGLETHALVEMALSLGVEHGQGYALSRPMPADALADWLRNWHWRLDAARPSTALGRQALLFARDVAPLDWQRVIMSHQQYREVLGRSIGGEGAPLQWAIVSRDDACLLGRWMKRQALTIWPEARPLFNHAQELHADFHRRAGDLVRRAFEDDQRAKVLGELEDGELDHASERLVRALHQLSWVMSVDAGMPEGLPDEPHDEAPAMPRA